MQKIVIVTAAALALITTSAAAEEVPPSNFYNGNGLYEECNSTADSVAAVGYLLHCQGYIVGVADALVSMGRVCLPEGTTEGQVVDIVVRSLRDHPETRLLPAAFFVEVALVAAFSLCR